VVAVTGTVTRGGRPVEGLVVNFLPEHGRASWGLAGPGGQYRLHYERGRDGAVTGRHTVWVEVRPANAKEDAERRGGGLRPHPEMKAILEKYGSPLTSPLKVEVRDEGQVIDPPLE
jgi:hypothetical protein